MPVEISEQFLVAHRLQGCEPSFVVQRKSLLFQSGLHHQIHPLVYAPVQFLPVPLQAQFHDIEFPFFLLPRLERGKGPSRHQAYLQRPYHPLIVLYVDGVATFRVELLQLPGKTVHSLFPAPCVQLRPQSLVRAGEIVQPFAYGIYVETTSSGHYESVVSPAEKLAYQLQRFHFVEAGRVEVFYAVVLDEIMFDCLQ